MTLHNITSVHTFLYCCMNFRFVDAYTQVRGVVYEYVNAVNYVNSTTTTAQNARINR